jgi:hypothetical protein
MKKTNGDSIENRVQQRRTTKMNGFPGKATTVFAALTVAGTVMAVMAGEVATGFEQTVLAEMGSAMFGGSLAFFLIEMFHRERERNSDKLNVLTTNSEFCVLPLSASFAYNIA